MGRRITLLGSTAALPNLHTLGNLSWVSRIHRMSSRGKERKPSSVPTGRSGLPLADKAHSHPFPHLSPLQWISWMGQEMLS